MHRFSPHARFFSSLDQVGNRAKFANTNDYTSANPYYDSNSRNNHYSITRLFAFFILFLQIEDRLAFEKNQKLSPRVELTPKSEFKESNSSSSQPDSMGSPLYLLNPIPNPNPNPVSPDNSGPAVDFLSDTETPQEEEQVLERNEVREEKKEAKRLD
jgi:hypothetical protein